MKEIRISLKRQEFSSEDEESLSAILTPAQVMHIENLKSDIAHEKLNMAFDIANPAATIAAQEYLRGQLGILQHLLDLSETTVYNLSHPQEE